MISKNKPQRGKIGTPYHIEKAHKKRRINCKYYDVDDGSCYKKSVVLWQVGYDICKNCRDKILIYDEKTNTKNKDTNEKAKKSNSNLQITNLIINSSRVKEVLKIANNCCELCNKKSQNLCIYVIDKNKPSEELDSILNIIAVCPTCKSKISNNKEKYLNDIKKITNDRLNKMV